MAVVVITPAVFYRVAGPYVRMLEEAGFTVRYPERPNPASDAEMVEALRGAVAVIAGGGDPLGETVISQVPELRVIARAGVGYDRVNVPAATARRIAVTITPTANHECVAEHTFALMLALARSVVPHHHDVLAGDWSRQLMLPLRGRTLGLIGLGRIGRSVAIRGRAFRMRVLACERYPDEAFVRTHGIELADLPTVLAAADYLSLHVPLSDETRGLINRETLGQMKRRSFLVNTARGGLVVEEDVVAALQSGHLGGAGLDVFEQEPTPLSNPLLTFKNVVASPHVGGGDTQSNEDMAIESAQNIIALSRGNWPVAAVVNGELRAGWSW